MSATPLVRFVSAGLLVASFGALALSFSACSSTTSTTAADGGLLSPDTGPTEDGGAPQDGGPVLDGGARPGDGGKGETQCTSQPHDACLSCCDTLHPHGASTFNTAFNACICAPPVGADGRCQTQCALTDCSAADDAGASRPGDPCDVCETKELGDGGACGTKIDTACGADPDCVALTTKCSNYCP